MTNQAIATAFIETIWNQQAFEQLDRFLHPEYVDHSLPPALPRDAEGTWQWIVNTGRAFEHRTEIESLVCDADRCIARISMHLKHTGSWRGIEATGIELKTGGYREFQFRQGQIIAHHALIDGQAIENHLSTAAKGCGMKFG